LRAAPPWGNVAVLLILVNKEGRRMQKIKALILLAGVLALPLGAQAQDAKAGEAAVKSAGCLKCHSVSADKAGPSYKSVAAKYKGQADAAAKLEKFVSGHEGGAKAKDQTKNIVAYILSR
jgi:cytochrome c